MRVAWLLDIIKAASGRLRIDSPAGYDQERDIDDLNGKDFITKDMAYAISASDATHFDVNKLGSQVDADGNIDTSGDSIPTGKKLLSVEIDNEPDFTQHFYSQPQNLVYGFDASISPTAAIKLTFI